MADLAASVESIAPAILKLQETHKFTHIISPASAAGKNILPRVAAKLDVSMISEIIGVESEDTFQRPIYAGNAIARVKSNDSVKVGLPPSSSSQNARSFLSFFFLGHHRQRNFI